MDLLYKGNDLEKRDASLASALWEATRPRMFPVWVSSSIVPAAIAIRQGVFDPLTFVLEALLCFCLLTLSCWADEYGDFDHGVDNEDRLGPHRPLQRGEISMRQMLVACLCLAAFSLAVIITLISYSCLRQPTPAWVPWALLGAGAVAIVSAFLYTIGKHPYGYHGWGDLSAYLFFGPVACMVGFWAYGHTWDWSVLLPASAVGMMLVVTINLQNIRDFDNDEAHGKRTTAVCLGKRGAVAYHYVLIAASAACYIAFPIANGMTNPLHYLFVVALIPFAQHAFAFRRVIAQGDPKQLDTLMWPLCRGMLIACVAFCICMVLPV